MIPTPTKDYVEARGGFWIGSFIWPLSSDDSEYCYGVKTPEGQLRHSWISHVTKQVRVYTLPETRPSKVIPGPHAIENPVYAGGK